MFLKTIPFNFYALGTLMFMFMIVIMDADYGPMRKFESAPVKSDKLHSNNISVSAEESLPAPISEKGRVVDMVIPVVVLIATSVFFMVYTGGITEVHGQRAGSWGFPRD